MELRSPIELAKAAKEIGNEFGFTTDAVLYFYKKEYIGVPLRNLDKIGLFYIKKIWNDHNAIKIMLDGFSKKKRMMMVTNAGANEIELYILNKFMTHFANKLEKRQLHIYAIASEVMERFGIPEERRNEVVALTKKIRFRAYKQAKHSCKLSKYMVDSP